MTSKQYLELSKFLKSFLDCYNFKTEIHGVKTEILRHFIAVTYPNEMRNDKLWRELTPKANSMDKITFLKVFMQSYHYYPDIQIRTVSNKPNVVILHHNSSDKTARRLMYYECECVMVDLEEGIIIPLTSV